MDDQQEAVEEGNLARGGGNEYSCFQRHSRLAFQDTLEKKMGFFLID
jgi:hypothetical protein